MTTTPCQACAVQQGTHQPAEALHQIAEPQPTALGYADAISAGLSYTAPHILALAADELRAQHARIAELEDAADIAIERIEDLESQLAAIGAGGVEPLRKQEAAPQAAQGMDMVNCKSGNWLTVVYRDIRPGDEARTIGEHPKVSALSWSHALNDRDAALAAQAKQGEQP